MDDEFKLCWKNFQDNIASGFQNLYDRGDLVDVTLACDGKLLQAHKIVLAICSPYFQEIFTTNPCQHPIIILKDVSFNIMCELLEFMYQGVVNVKHTELQSFMKIGQLLQIKGLATNSNSPPGSSASEKSTSQATNAAGGDEPNSSSNASSQNHSKADADQAEPKGSSRTPTNSPSSSRADTGLPLYMQTKRPAPAEFSSDSLSIYSRKQLRRSLTEQPGGESIDNADSGGGGMENALGTEEFFLPPIPHISMVEPRYDMGSLKREAENHQSGSSGPSTAGGSLRNPFAPAFNLDYNNFYKAGNSSGASSSSNVSGVGVSMGNNNGGGSSGSGSGGGSSLGVNATEYPNDLYMPSDYSKNFANHMDIPSRIILA
ncbi:protein bric-a-brac 1 isoform X3 [Drosophila novamexicana]|uniref:protein bric-a-brac 1 isoform X3 n=1 Tax=Drosophila novamexicana TaxID=47314 RepID=UPI0011E5CD4E|nr:protein bric-a-brac 1 isoform X3 [Drosophila novamexicana]